MSTIGRVNMVMILLSLLVLQQLVMGARYLQFQEKAEYDDQIQDRSNGIAQDFFATVNRQVPSASDPLHNR
ncbi:hypothetical protein Leryth_016400 [Lithospermum erythrorhizon]|nr:hypothetical protein Leryth_016400 [Lithospermum erythrorhizon]